MLTVNRNSAIYKWAELLVIAPSLVVLMVFVDRPTWLGLAIAALVIAVPLMVLDVIGERNGLLYFKQLKSARASTSVS